MPGDIEVLVATTVIEVGVDVPEATVMVIEDADRFGIAQLHQLRGRVGRGNEPSWCYLLSENEAPEAEARLSAMERTTDGFELAEVDLELRGEGTILGARQKGRSDLRLAKLIADQDLVVRRPRDGRGRWWATTPSSSTTRCWSRSCASSSTTTRPSSCSRADRPGSRPRSARRRSATGPAGTGRSRRAGR